MLQPDRKDDPTIHNDERLWRRVPPGQIIWDSNLSGYRPSSAVFRPSDEMSVDIASLTTPEAVLFNYAQYSLIEFEAGVARNEGCIIVRDPLPENPSHALVCGSNAEGRLTKSQAKNISRYSRWIILKHPPIE